VILVVLASVNAVFTTWATVIDAERANALARALGATPGQVSAGLAASQLLPGLLAACMGIPAGLALYALGGGHLAEDRPPILWLIAVIPGTLLVVAAVTAIPARLGATRSPAAVLRAD
jgi:putative ABC transport system permease protein